MSSVDDAKSAETIAVARLIIRAMLHPDPVIRELGEAARDAQDAAYAALLDESRGDMVRYSAVIEQVEKVLRRPVTTHTPDENLEP